MNPEAMPTPFDIVPIAGVPYQPGLIEWIALLLVLALLTVIFVLLKRRIKRKEELKASSVYASTKSLLTEYSKSGGNSRKELAVVCLLVRRFLSVVTGIDCTAMDWKELRQVAVENKSLEPLITDLCKYEEMQYAPAEHIPAVREVAESFIKDLPEQIALNEELSSRRPK